MISKADVALPMKIQQTLYARQCAKDRLGRCKRLLLLATASTVHQWIHVSVIENVNLQSGTNSRCPATATDQLAVRPMHDDFRRYRVRCDLYRIQWRIAAGVTLQQQTFDTSAAQSDCLHKHGMHAALGFSTVFRVVIVCMALESLRTV